MSKQTKEKAAGDHGEKKTALARYNSFLSISGLFSRIRILNFLRFPTFIMQKTKKAIAKRFKVTGSGKLMRRTQGFRHLLRSKSTKARRRAGADKPVSEGFSKRLLPAILNK